MNRSWACVHQHIYVHFDTHNMPSAKWRLELWASVRMEAQHFLVSKIPACASTRGIFAFSGHGERVRSESEEASDARACHWMRRQGRTTDMNVEMGCTRLYIVAHPYLCSPPHAIFRSPAAAP